VEFTYVQPDSIPRDVDTRQNAFGADAPWGTFHGSTKENRKAAARGKGVHQPQSINIPNLCRYGAS
jgi:hypothetical protein